jgi:hypothetical protein
MSVTVADRSVEIVLDIPSENENDANVFNISAASSDTSIEDANTGGQLKDQQRKQDRKKRKRKRYCLQDVLLCIMKNYRMLNALDLLFLVVLW